MATSPTESNPQHHTSGNQAVAKREALGELISPLSVKEQSALRNRRAVVSPVSRRFVSRIVIAAPVTTVWDVLTDYDNFYRFLPTVVSSNVVESEGDRKVVEQVDNRTILLANVRTTVRTENIAIPKKRINFRLVGGDMNKFDGHWQVYPVTVDGKNGEQTDQTLLLQSAEVDAGPAFFEGIVHSLITDSLKANITAIRDEAEKRATA